MRLKESRRSIKGFRLSGGAVIVTGGAGAIGSAVCEAFAAAGARVAVVDLDQEKSSQVAYTLGQGHRGWGVDLSDVGSHRPLMFTVEETLGPVHTLVNAAGTLKRTFDLLDITEAEWDLQHTVNLKAMFFLIQAFAGRLISERRRGSIINFTSQGALTGGYDGSIVYNAAKGGVLTMTRGLARCLATKNIRVNAIAPGFIETPMLLGDRPAEAERERMAAMVPMGRLGAAADCADATVFLASDAAKYITGATLNVSGGLLMY